MPSPDVNNNWHGEKGEEEVVRKNLTETRRE
jgi:hypothetical protein